MPCHVSYQPREFSSRSRHPAVAYAYELFAYGSSFDLSGVVITSAKDGLRTLDGICYPVQRQGDTFSLDASSAYFYGTVQRLQRNYRNGIPASLDLLSYQDRKLSVDYISTHRIGGWFRIPVPELHLPHHADTLLGQLAQHVQQMLPLLFENPQYHNIGENRKFLKKIPVSVEQKILQHSGYYSKTLARMSSASPSADSGETTPLRSVVAGKFARHNLSGG